MIVVTVALPVYNAEPYLDDCLSSIRNQQRCLPEPKKSESSYGDFIIEVSIFDDGSTDGSTAIIQKWSGIFQATEGFTFCLSRNESGAPKGVGYGRNRTIQQASGEFICFCDADDIMEPDRIATQLKLCLENPEAIVGSKFKRIPEDSTKNFTRWANSISEGQLTTQIYLSFGPSIVMPSWFCSRDTYNRVEGGFDENGKGVPEDLIFFYKHLDHGGKVLRADKELIHYRYHEGATTFSVTDEVIWNIRLERLEGKVLNNWSKFTIWNAGKLGRRFYRSLRKENMKKVSCFCDVDAKKISQKWYQPYPIRTKVPVIHVKDASPPFIICVKTEMTFGHNGDFCKLLESLNIQEGIDYFYFN